MAKAHYKKQSKLGKRMGEKEGRYIIYAHYGKLKE
jgi:hypothetical protein